MTWGKLLQPDLVLENSILSLTAETIQRNGLQGLVLDVDETLVPFNSSQITTELEDWLAELRPHLKGIWLVSNNLSQIRIGRIAEALDLPYILGARKPSRRKVRLALQQLDLPVEKVGMVGDRLFTDVLVGNRLGMYTILVEPMVDPSNMPRKYLIRNVEVWLSQKLGVTLSHDSESHASH